MSYASKKLKIVATKPDNNLYRWFMEAMAWRAVYRKRAGKSPAHVNKYQLPHQGKQERARRVRQMEASK